MSLPTNVIEEDGQGGTRALLFSYKMYLMPNGDIKTAVSNVDTDKLKAIFVEGMGGEAEEYANQVNSAIHCALRNAENLDKEISEHLAAL
jgi:hypothetical protein